MSGFWAAACESIQSTAGIRPPRSSLTTFTPSSALVALRNDVVSMRKPSRKATVDSGTVAFFELGCQEIPASVRMSARK